jgi:hypothetical protein
LSVAYHIQDEPIGGGRRSVPALDPFWPLLAMMFGGAWIGAAAFAFNAWVLRGPTRAREIGLAFAILIGSPVILLVLGVIGSAGALPGSAFKYAVLLIVAWKLGLAYWIFFRQQSAYALYEYFGGGANRAQAVPIGTLLVFAGGYLKPQVVKAIASPFWQVMVS